jgi:hypothetical protein
MILLEAKCLACETDLTRLIVLALAAEPEATKPGSGTVEKYAADWLEGGKTIYRDASGRFASGVKREIAKQAIEDTGRKVARTAQDLGESAGIAIVSIPILAEIGLDAVRNLATNPDFRRRAGLMATQAMGSAIAAFAKKLSEDSKVAKIAGEYAARAQKELEKEYGAYNNPVTQAVWEARSLVDSTVLSRPEARLRGVKKQLTLGICQYVALEQALKKPRKISKDILDVSKASLYGIVIPAVLLGSPIAGVGVGTALLLLSVPGIELAKSNLLAYFREKQKQEKALREAIASGTKTVEDGFKLSMEIAKKFIDETLKAIQSKGS